MTIYTSYNPVNNSHRAVNHQGSFIFDNLINTLNQSIDDGLYDVNDRNDHLSILRHMTTLYLTVEQSNWLICQILNGENPITIYTGFIIRFIPILPFENTNIVNNARPALENAFNNNLYARNSIADALNELVDLPLTENQFDWITTQINNFVNPIQIIISFLELFVVCNQNYNSDNINFRNNTIYHNEIVIHHVQESIPLNPFINFIQMPEWFRNTIMLSLSRNTDISYTTLQELFNHHENILSVVMHIFSNYLINNITLYYQDRTNNHFYNWIFRRS